MSLPERIDRYQVLGFLGQGGSGSVLRARDPESGRVVAIKLLRLTGAVSDLADERLRREIQALAKLSHPNIVAIHDRGTLNGSPYLVLDCVEGVSLADRLDGAEPLTRDGAINLVTALARAVAHAHDAGVLHRDLNPNNVILTADKGPVLIDFGLSFEAGDDEQRLTKTGTIAGTPGFWAPEQALGELQRVGPQTDVFGLGGLLLFALSGQQPFAAGSLVEALDAVTQPVRVPTSLPADLAAICRQALSLDPSDRFASAREFEAALQRARVPDAPASARGAKLPLAVIVAGGLLAATIVAIGRQPTRPPSTSPPAADGPLEPPPPPATPLPQVTAPPPSATPQPPVTAPPQPLTPEERPEDADPAVDAELPRVLQLDRAGQRAEARELLQRLLEQAPSHFEATAVRAKFDLSDATDASLDRAAAAYTQLLERRPEDPRLLEGLGRTRVYQGDAAEGVRHLQAAIELDRRPARATYLARALGCRGQLSAALDWLDWVLTVTTDPSVVAEAHRLRLSVLRDLGRLDEARTAIAWLRAQREEPYQLWMPALFLEAEGQHEDAVRALEQVATRGGVHGLVWLHHLRDGHFRDFPGLTPRQPVNAYTKWQLFTADVLQGKREPEAMLEGADTWPNPYLRLRRRCEAHCFIALLHEQAGRIPEARAAYQATVDTGMFEETEHWWAQVRLRALAERR